MISVPLPNPAPAHADAAAAPVVRSLLLRFAQPLAAVELPAFRGAIAATVDAEAVLFHQHLPDGSLRYAYPLIQYRVVGGQAALFCVQEGVEAAQLLLQRPAWDLTLGGQLLTLTLADVRVRQHRLLLLPADEPPTLRYRLRQWLPFNADTYAAWQAEPGLAGQYALLERLLVGHVLAFASGVNWYVPGPVRVALTAVREMRGVVVKGVRRVAFDVELVTNVVLPDHIGLGRHVSLGFGVLERARPALPPRSTRPSSFSADDLSA